ncbi:MAG: SGNH/GDSL hydrolase family protein [Myxococcota bacterium]
MAFRAGSIVLAAALLLAGCGDDSEPAGDTEGGGTTGAEETTGESNETMPATSGGGETTNDGGETSDGDSGSTTDDTSETTAGEVCGEVPTRMMFFGDSLYACFGQDDTINGMGCSARLAHEYLEATYAPGVTYENLAISGAVTQDVVDQQMPGASVGQPGHTLVVIWIGGNDISGLLLSPDDQAEDTYRNDLQPALDMLWTRMLAWVDDPANFPDGATLVINTQFNPFDDCTAEPYGFMSPLKTQLLGEYNDILRERVAERENTYLADQYPVFLGHGHHFGTAECPNYTEGNDYWMIGGTDLVHPNTLGHVSIAGTLNGTLDEIYGCD